jgi:hypothetical protein
VDNPAEIRPEVGSAAESGGEQSTGHAYYADQARRALGVGMERLLPRVPAPVFHGLVGGAVAATAVLARPQAVGRRTGALLDLVLAGICALTIVYYDRLVCSREARPGLGGGVLPAAAILGLAVALSGIEDVRLGAAAVLAAAAVIGVVPHLSALAAAGIDSWWLRALREVARLAVMIPVCLAGASALPLRIRAPIVFAGALATAHDTIRGEGTGRWRSLLGAFAVAVLCAAATMGATRVSSQAAGGAVLLFIWHGLRGMFGMFGQLPADRRQRLLVVEHGIFVLAGGVALGVLK